MNKEIKFLKLYEKYEEGFEIRAIISYCKMPYLMQYSECIQHKIILHINLWFVIIRLNWLTKIK